MKRGFEDTIIIAGDVIRREEEGRRRRKKEETLPPFVTRDSYEGGEGGRKGDFTRAEAATRVVKW